MFSVQALGLFYSHHWTESDDVSDKNSVFIATSRSRRVTPSTTNILHLALEDLDLRALAPCLWFLRSCYRLPRQ